MEAKKTQEPQFNDLVLMMTDDGPLMGYIDNNSWENEELDSFIMRNPVIVLFQNENAPDGQQGVSISLKGFMPYPIGRVMSTNALVEIFMSEVKNMMVEEWIDPSLKTAYHNQFSKIHVPNSVDLKVATQQVPNPMHVVKN